MPNFSDPGFIREMVKDLSRIFQLLKKSLPNVKIVEGMELICGKKYNLEKATAAAMTRSTPPATPMGRWRFTCKMPSPRRRLLGQEGPCRSTGTAAAAAASALTASVSQELGGTKGRPASAASAILSRFRQPP